MKFYVIAMDWSDEENIVESIGYKTYEEAAAVLDSRPGLKRDWPPEAGYWVREGKNACTFYYNILEVTVAE